MESNLFMFTSTFIKINKMTGEGTRYSNDDKKKKYSEFW